MTVARPIGVWSAGFEPCTAGFLIPFSDPEGVLGLGMAEEKELVGSAKNPIDVLAKKVGSEWRNVAKARAFTQEYRLELKEEIGRTRH